MSRPTTLERQARQARKESSGGVSGFASVAALAFLVSVIAQPQPRARDLGIAPAFSRPARAMRSPTSRASASGTPRSSGRPRADRRDGDRAARRQRVSGQGRRRGLRRQRLRQAGRIDAGQELGTIETPIVLTNTLSVGTAMDAVVRYTLAQPGNQRVRSVNALVGETNDGGLNDIRGLHVTREHVMAAIRARAGRGRRRGRSARALGRSASAGKAASARRRAICRRRRLHGGRAGADELRRQPDDRGRAGLPGAAAAAALPIAQPA